MVGWPRILSSGPQQVDLTHPVPLEASHAWVAGAAALTLRSVPACAGGAASSALAAETEGINLLAPSAPCDSSAADQAEFDGLSARDVGPWLFKRALRECSRGHSTDSGYSWREVAGTMSLIAARNGSEGKAFTRTNVQHYLGRLSRDRAASRTPRPGAARARSQAQHARAQLQLRRGRLLPITCTLFANLNLGWRLLRGMSTAPSRSG